MDAKRARAGVVMLVWLAAASAAGAATVNVTTTEDEDNGTPSSGSGAGTSLREAVKYSAVGDTVAIPAGVYRTATELWISKFTILQGAGRNATIIEAGDLPQELGGTGVQNRSALVVATGGSAEIRDLMLRHGRRFSGGGLKSVSGTTTVMERVVIRDNVAFSTTSAGANGGGIVGASDSVLTLTDVTVENNLAASAMGPAAAGGIDVGGRINALRCTISGNRARGAGSSVVGGGVRTQNAVTGSSFVLCTFSGNVAESTNQTIARSGAMESFQPGLVLESCTFTGNSATHRGGAMTGSSTSEFAVTLRNCIVWGNSAPTGPNLHYGVSSTGYNLIGTTGEGVEGYILSPAGTDIVNAADPLLQPLADNGGYTKTHALSPDSPACDAGIHTLSDGTTVLATDQRGTGYARVSGSGADVGAFEYQVPQPTATPSPSPSPSPTATATPSPSASPQPATPTPHPTHTPVHHTPTPTHTPVHHTPTPTVTHTAHPTRTPTPTPHATATPHPTHTPGHGGDLQPSKPVNKPAGKQPQ